MFKSRFSLNKFFSFLLLISSFSYFSCADFFNEYFNFSADIESAEISGSTSVYIGSTITLTVEVIPSVASSNIVWSSSNSSIATVDKYGVVKGVSEGSVLIQVSSKNIVVDTYKINVYAQLASSISISGTSHVYEGESSVLKASVSPTNASADVSWSSSDTSIAVIDSDGNVTGLSEGSVTITATANDGSCVCDFLTVTIS